MSKKTKGKNAKKRKPKAAINVEWTWNHPPPTARRQKPSTHPLFQTSNEKGRFSTLAHIAWIHLASIALAIGVETEEGQRTKGAWLRNVDIPKISIDQSGYGFMSMCDQLTNLWRCISFFFFLITKLSFTVKCTIFGFCMSSMINTFLLVLLQANAFWLTQKRKRK